MRIQFYWLKYFRLNGRTQLKEFIKYIFKKEHREFSYVNFIFCDDEYLLGINKAYLNHDFHTDIISFELNHPGEPIQGEVYISIDRVKENAEAFEVSSSNELLRVIFHGILHFCGYNDKLPKDQQKMRAKEDYYLREYCST